MTPTLCNHCGWHVGRCRCAALVRSGVVLAAETLERSVQNAGEQLGPLTTGQQIAVKFILACASRIRDLAHPKGDA